MIFEFRAVYWSLVISHWSVVVMIFLLQFIAILAAIEAQKARNFKNPVS